MTSLLFTRAGVEHLQRIIRAQERKVRAIGKEVGEAAGINCDWHDNFPYEDAKRRLELEATLLKRLSDELAAANIVTVQEQDEEVLIGATVSVLVNGQQKVFTIGAYGESDPARGLITYTSPMARALLHLRVGESRTSTIAGRRVNIEIIDIAPPSARYWQLVAQIYHGVCGDQASA